MPVGLPSGRGQGVAGNRVRVTGNRFVTNGNGTQTGTVVGSDLSIRHQKSTGDTAPGTFGIPYKQIEAGQNPRRRLAEKLARNESGSLVQAYAAQRRRAGSKGY